MFDEKKAKKIPFRNICSSDIKVVVHHIFGLKDFKFGFEMKTINRHYDLWAQNQWEMELWTDAFKYIATSNK